MITKIRSKRAKIPKKRVEIYSNRIKNILIEKKMSQAELSRVTGISEPHLSSIIRGEKKNTSLVLALNISKALETAVDKIFLLKQ